MKKTLAILTGTTLLAAAIGIPTWSAMASPGRTPAETVRTLFEDGAAGRAFHLADWDGDDDDDDDHDCRASYGDDDDDHTDDDDDDDDDCGNTAMNPAPAGSVTPPQNGLFGNGAAPQVEMK